MSRKRVSEVFSDAKKAPAYMYVRLGKRGHRFLVRYRKHGVSLEQYITDAEGREITDWKSALRRADELIAEARFGKKKTPKPLVSPAQLASEIIATKGALSEATAEQTRIFFEKHIVPALEGRCAYSDSGTPCPAPHLLKLMACATAAELTAPKWLYYKTHFRIHRPESPLFNHFKFFGMLCKYAHDIGVLSKRLVLEYDEKTEDNRGIGNVLTPEEIRAIVKHANPLWRDLTICLRLTGQRFGVIRRLSKDEVDFEAGVIRVPKWMSKNRRAYAFRMPVTVKVILQRRAAEAKGKYLFPGRGNPNRPMTKTYGGWQQALKDAGLNPEYTPHDLRHTYATYAFREKAANPAVICYQIDMSLEEARRTYLHFNADDTAPLAEAADREGQALIGGAA